MKILKRTVAVIVVLLVAVKLSPYEYLIKGVKNTYLKGYTSAHLYDRCGIEQFFDSKIGHYPSYADCCSRRLHRFLGRPCNRLHPGI